MKSVIPLLSPVEDYFRLTHDSGTTPGVSFDFRADGQIFIVRSGTERIACVVQGPACTPADLSAAPEPI
jgi:hypothetical protein